MRFGSLFSGIGGLDLGLERAGMECAWQVEIDDYCTRVLEKHWPSVVKHREVEDVGGHNLEAVDLIAGGFPCQPVSFAGKQKAQDDSRWLWPQFSRIINELRPRWVFIENVTGLLHRGMGDILYDLSEGGYHAIWDTLPASAFGALHKRDRVYVVAYPDSERGCLWDYQGEDAEGVGQSPRRSQFRYWDIEPEVGRVAHGVPSRVDRLRGLGNAVVPQVAEWIGRRIIEHERR